MIQLGFIQNPFKIISHT